MSFSIRPNKNIAVAFTPTTPVPTGGSDSEILTNIQGNYNSNTYSYYGYQQQGGNIFANNTATNLPNASFVNRPFGGGCLAPNGKIYFTPWDSPYNWCIVNPYNDTYTLKRSILSTLSGGCVCAHNGKIYAPTFFGSTSVRVLDTLNNDTEYLIRTIAGGWGGCCLGVNGNVYCIPLDFGQTIPKIMVINPNDDSVSYFDVSGINWPYVGGLTGGIGDANGDDVWYTGALAPNGKIYCPPARATSILVIDTVTNTAECDISGLSGFPQATGPGSLQDKYWGAALTQNGFIYGAPGSIGTNAIRIDTSNNTWTSVTYSGSNPWPTGRKARGIVYAPNNKLYANLDVNAAIVVLDLNTNPITGSTIASSSNNGAPCLAPNGRVYFVPRSGSIKYVNTGIPNLSSWMLAPEFNKQ